jgi:hypothetical protein
MQEYIIAKTMEILAGIYEQLPKELAERLDRAIYYQSRYNPNDYDHLRNAYGLLNWTETELTRLGVTVSQIRSMDLYQQCYLAKTTALTYPEMIFEKSIDSESKTTVNESDLVFQEAEVQQQADNQKKNKSVRSA